MRHSTMRHSNRLRAIAVAAVIVTVVGASGCRWFRGDSAAYRDSAESRPLEVPPDLDRPNTEGAIRMPSADTGQSVTRSSMSTPAAGNTSGFTVAGERDAVFQRVGEALAATPGVTIASKAQLLGTYDVSYEGSDFLVRITKVDAGIYVSAVDPRGMPASGAAAAKLIATLQSRLGG